MKYMKFILALLLLFASPGTIFGASSVIKVQLTDDLEAPKGFARVFIQDFSVDPPREVPITLESFSITYLTFTKEGNIVNITFGDGDFFNNLVWTQEENFKERALLFIDFRGTKVEKWISGFGGNHIILTAPDDFSSTGTGLAQIGDSAIRFFVDAGSLPREVLFKKCLFGHVEATQFFVSAWPKGLNFIPNASLTYSLIK